MRAKTKEEYRKAWKGHVNELFILSFSFDMQDKEFTRLSEIVQELKGIVDVAAEKQNLPEK